MQFQQIPKNDDAHAHHCPNWVGPDAGLPALPAGFPDPPMRCARPAERRGLATAAVDVDIARLARDALCKRLNDYKLEAVLGKGAFGCVYQAVDISARDHGKKVAIKQIPRMHVVGSGREMLFTEKRILSNLTQINSPYFTPLIESFMDPHNFTIVQGLAAGGSLRGTMNNARTLFRMHEIKFIMAQLCYAVGVMHDQNVVHRDLKPDNVFMDGHGRLVIGDFGLGHLFKGHQVRIDEMYSYNDYWHRTSGKCGTPGYMAPELIRGDHYSYKVDSFSVGVMFYELVFGRLPFRGRDSKDLEDSALYRSAYIPRWFRKRYPAACSLMQRLLAKNADHRIAMQDTLQSRYFRGVNWDQVAVKTQPVPAGWKPAPRTIPEGAYLSMCVLVDDLHALQRWRPDPAEYEFLAPLRWRPGKEYPVFVPLAVMSPPANSPDLREERLAVGLMVKQVLGRGRRNRQPQEFLTVPLNEPIPTPKEVLDVHPASNDGHRPFPYDFPHRITDDGQQAEPAAVHSLFSVGEQPLAQAERCASVAKDVKGTTGFSLFDVSIVSVPQYKADVDAHEPKLFLSFGLEESPMVRQGPAPILLSSLPLCMYATSEYPSSPLPLTPSRTSSDEGPSNPVDFPTFHKGLGRTGNMSAALEDCGDQMLTSPTLLAPSPRKADGDQALFDAPVWLLN